MSRLLFQRNVGVISRVPGAPAGTVIPTDITNLQLWLKADTIALTEGAAVTNWLDSSGNGRTFTQASAGLKPLYRTTLFNGLPAVDFDGVDDRLATSAILSSFITNAAFTVFVVFSAESAHTSAQPYNADGILHDGFGQYWGLHLNGTGFSCQCYNWDGNADYVPIPVSAGERMLVTWRHDSGNLISNINGGVDETPVASGNTSDLTHTLAIGDQMDGKIAEIAVYNRVLTPTERTNLNTYFVDKYGLGAAPAGNTFNQRPYVATAPWNRTLANKYPSGVPIHASSNTMIANLKTPFTGGADFVNWTGDPTQFTMPVYVVDGSTPTESVVVDSSYRFGTDATTDGYFGGAPITVRVPAGIKPSAGSDSQIVILDLASNKEFNFSNCGKDPDGGWGIGYDSDDVFVNDGMRHCNNAGVYTGLTTGIGVPGTTPKFWSTRGPGVLFMGGLIRPWEIIQGHIDHALAFALNWAANGDPATGGGWVYPACKSDGADVNAPGAIPESAVVRLKSSVNPLSYTNPIAQMVGVAMQTYGAYCIDNAGRPKIYFEYQSTAKWGIGGVPAVTADSVSEILLNDMEVVDWNVAWA